MTGCKESLKGKKSKIGVRHITVSRDIVRGCRLVSEEATDQFLPDSEETSVTRAPA